MTSTPAQFIGFSGTFLSSIYSVSIYYGKIMAAACDIWSSSMDKIFCAISSVVWAYLLMFGLFFVTSQSTCNGWCLYSFVCSIKLSTGDSLFLSFIDPHAKTGFPWWVFVRQYFLKHNIKVFIKTFSGLSLSLWPPWQMKENWVALVK